MKPKIYVGSLKYKEWINDQCRYHMDYYYDYLYLDKLTDMMVLNWLEAGDLLID